MQSEDDDGNIDTEEKLVAVSSPLLHSRFHYPDQAAITADYLVLRMKEEVAKNPLAPVGTNSQVNVLCYFCLTQVSPETRF